MTSRIILITGANSGVGYAATKVLADFSKSYHVIMTGRSLDKVNRAMAEVEASAVKGSLSAIQMDVTDEESIASAVEHVREHHERIDVLVNNAGVGGGLTKENPRARMQMCLETNVMGPFLVAGAFRPLLMKSQQPYSVYITSGGGSLTNAHKSYPGAEKIPSDQPYMSSKTALNMIGALEHRDFGQKGLKVFLMCPGFVVSNLRGPDEDAKHGWGQAGDPLESGKTLLSILQGERDSDVGKVVHKDGVHPW